MTHQEIYGISFRINSNLIKYNLATVVSKTGPEGRIGIGQKSLQIAKGIGLLVLYSREPIMYDIQNNKIVDISAISQRLCIPQTIKIYISYYFSINILRKMLF